MALSRVAYQEIAYNGTTDTRAFTSITWLTGDLIIIWGSGEDSVDRPIGAPTVAGLTFTALSGFPNNAASNTYVGGWQATAASGSSGGPSITAAGTAGKMWGAGLWQWRGHNGIGVIGDVQAGAATASVSMAVSAQSAVCGIWSDWSATAMGKTATPTISEGVDGNTVENAQYTGQSIFSADWLAQAAGTRNYGITSATGAKSTLGFVEIKELAVAYTPGIVPNMQTRIPA